METRVSLVPDIRQESVAGFPGFHGSDGLDSISMTSHENYGVLEMPFKTELNNVTAYEPESENALSYVHEISLGNLNQEVLSLEEEKRRKLRRDRNKVAASKCRKKRKQHVHNLAEMSDELEEENNNLQSQINKLQTEIKKLESMLDSHSCYKNSNNLQSE